MEVMNFAFQQFNLWTQPHHQPDVFERITIRARVQHHFDALLKPGEIFFYRLFGLEQVIFITRRRLRIAGQYFDPIIEAGERIDPARR